VSKEKPPLPNSRCAPSRATHHLPAEPKIGRGDRGRSSAGPPDAFPELCPIVPWDAANFPPQFADRGISWLREVALFCLGSQESLRSNGRRPIARR
jgi:hypothetical protein